MCLCVSVANKITTEEPAIMILSVINGIVRYKKLNGDREKNLRQAAVNFCRRSLMNGNMKGQHSETRIDNRSKSQEQT